MGRTVVTKARKQRAKQDAVRVDPVRPKLDMSAVQAVYEQGMALAANSQFVEAIQVFEECLKSHGSIPEILYVLGITHQRLQEHRLAIIAFDRITDTTPRFAMAHYACGVSYHTLELYPEAISAYDRAIALNPLYPEALNNRGIAFQRLGRWEEACRSHRAAIIASPTYTDAYNSLGVALHQAGQTGAAIKVFEQALDFDQNHRETLNNLGMCLHEVGQLEDAIVYFDRAVNLADSALKAYSTRLSRPSVAPGSVEVSKRTYTRSKAMARFNRSLAALQHGDFEAGWPDYEYRSLTPSSDPSPVVLETTWKGDVIPGKTIYVRTEQGLGDSIQFVRYLPMVRERCGKVILECPQELTELFGTCAGIDAVVANPGGGRMWATPEGAEHVFLLSLPGIFNTAIESVPNNVPYLTAPPYRRVGWHARITAMQTPKDNMRIGIVWAGNSGHTNDRSRSCALRDFAPLFGLVNATIFSLQKGDPSKQIVGSDLNIIDLSPDLHDFADTAAAVEEMDLIITVDTSVAHLAGALAKPVWTVLSLPSDWRWMLERSDSPWYPTMRLFRKIQRVSWNNLFEQVTAELVEITATAQPAAQAARI